MSLRILLLKKKNRKNQIAARTQGILDNTPTPFSDHLEELRRRVLLSAAAVFIASAAAFLYHRTLISIIKHPIGSDLVFIAPQEAFVVSLKAALLAGVVISSPVTIYHIWRFVGVALNRREKGFVLGYAPVALVLFLSGVVFAFFIVLPAGLRFLLSFGGPFLTPMITVDRYVSFILLIVIVFGAVFQLPLLMRTAAASGITDKNKLASGRKYAIVSIFTGSALLTPPDVFTQIALALPVILLYEIGLIITPRRRT